jgi:hypothetical protein
MKSWMVVFNQETWATLLSMPSQICAFNDIPGRRFPLVAVGDRFICYISGAKAWAGILYVTGGKYRSEEQLYVGGVFPNRVPVRAEITFGNLDDAVKMLEFEGTLSFFPQGGSAKNWAPHVRISPRIMHVPDATVIATRLSQQFSSKGKAA